MGFCCSSPASIQDEPLNLQLDPTNPMFIHSYDIIEERVFKKKLYNWHSIPIITVIPIPPDIFQKRKYFEVRNRGIQRDNFLVGVIKRIALMNEIPQPWQSNVCMCFQSHQNERQGGVIFDNKLVKVPGRVMEGEVVRISISHNQIDFAIGGISIHTRSIPLQLQQDQILPYVALFSPGDKIQFVTDIRQIGRQ